MPKRRLTMPARASRYVSLLGLCCLLGACGFQLRGIGDGGAALPDNWKQMHLTTGNPNSELSRDVQSVFAANGIVWQEKKDANFDLILGPERFKQTNLSLNSEARVSEYELELQAQFSVSDAEGNEVMALTSASVMRQMENDPRNVQGKSEEIRILKSEMRTQLSQQILRRIGFFASTTAR
jgi:LPS-assembly lipoprotein